MIPACQPMALYTGCLNSVQKNKAMILQSISGSSVRERLTLQTSSSPSRNSVTLMTAVTQIFLARRNGYRSNRALSTVSNIPNYTTAYDTPAHQYHVTHRGTVCHQRHREEPSREAAQLGYCTSQECQLISGTVPRQHNSIKYVISSPLLLWPHYLLRTVK